MDVGDVDIDLDDLQAGGALDLVDDVAANVVADVDDGVAVLDATMTSMAVWVSPLWTVMPPVTLVWAVGMRSVMAVKARRMALPML